MLNVNQVGAKRRSLRRNGRPKILVSIEHGPTDDPIVDARRRAKFGNDLWGLLAVLRERASEGRRVGRNAASLWQIGREEADAHFRPLDASKKGRRCHIFLAQPSSVTGSLAWAQSRPALTTYFSLR